MTALLRDGPPDAGIRVLLAHGAGSGMAHPFLADFAAGLAATGLGVVRFEFPYRAAGKRLPDPLPVLQRALCSVAAGLRDRPLVLAGKSLGGRVASTVADELAVAGVLAIGYPFHPPKRPQQLRTAHLQTLRTPMRIVQGERDPFGTRDEVAGYALPTAIGIDWLPDGDHSLVPRRASGFTAQQHLATAIRLAAEFVHGLRR